VITPYFAIATLIDTAPARVCSNFIFASGWNNLPQAVSAIGSPRGVTAQQSTFADGFSPRSNDFLYRW
jgi:hypothetical protein